jgi:ribosomal protein S18 acetylase RimI-like enzyme
LILSEKPFRSPPVKSESIGPGLAAAMPVRDATPADVDGLVELESVCFDADRISSRSFRRLIGGATASCRVVVSAGQIVASALILFRAGTDIARLYSIAVHPRNRGVGLARLLLTDSEQRAVAHGCARLRLEVREDNSAAIGLYERAGYRRIGRYPDYYADGVGALRFEKQLPPADAGKALRKR